MTNNKMNNKREILKSNKKSKETFDAEKLQANFEDFIEKYMSNQNKDDKLEGNSDDLGDED